MPELKNIPFRGIYGWWLHRSRSCKCTLILAVLAILFSLFSWWWSSTQEYSSFTLLFITTSVVIAVSAIISSLVWGWQWIKDNSSNLNIIATFIVGMALASFAWLTYDLSNRMVQYQVVPLIQPYSRTQPAEWKIPIGGATYQGVLWDVGILNSGPNSTLLDSFRVYIYTPPKIPWEQINDLCVLLDKNNNNLEIPKIIPGNTDIDVRVFLCDENVTKYLDGTTGVQDKTELYLSFWQEGQLGSNDISRFQYIYSDLFVLPPNTFTADVAPSFSGKMPVSQ